MTKETVNVNVERPTIEDYNEKYPTNPCDDVQKELLFDLITTPRHIFDAIRYVESTGNTPLRHYATVIAEIVGAGNIGELDDTEKQIAGKVVRVVMEANGFTRTKIRQRFNDGIFASGTQYTRN